jgi:signal transduction histidine kinase
MGARDRDRRTTPGSGERRPSDAIIPTHTRPRLRSSVRVRLLIPVLLAVGAVAGLTTMQINSALDQARGVDRSSTLAAAAGAVGALAHEVAAEYVASNADRRAAQRERLDEQIPRTEAVRGTYENLVPSLVLAAPDLTVLTEGVQRALDLLGMARSIAAQTPEGTAEVAAFYEQTLAALSSLAEAIPPHMDERSLIELARSVTIAAGLDRLAALQLDLVSRGLARGNVQPTEQITLAQWAGGERVLIEELTSLGVGGEAYSAVQRSAPSTAAASIRQVLLDDRSGDAIRGVSPLAWTNAQTARLADIWAMEQNLAARLDAEASALRTAARNRAFLVAGASSAAVAIILAGAIAMVIRFSRRLRRTRYAALVSARVELPAAIAHVIAAHDAGAVTAALNGSSARMGEMLHSGRDEIGELAAAFGTVHRQALRLAADQALTRLEVQAMFVALSRRGQTLVQRQIHLIDEFSRDVSDPDALAQWFALDHLAARMRRNEENLLVLAGGEPGRWITRPVAIAELIRAAAQEIEDYRRVDVAEKPDQAIKSNVAGDTVHLLAELLENATSFSSPETRVTVTARLTAGGLVVIVRDEGIGMPPGRLAEANERLSHPSALTSTLVGTMGLLVVARLAERHGMNVHLESVAGAGTTATLTVPETILVSLASEESRSAEWRRLEPPIDSARPRRVLEPSARDTDLLPALSAAWSPTEPSSDEPLPAATPTGLPRRPIDASESTIDATLPPPDGPDPELVRARLSSLASGLQAAANEAPGAGQRTLT